MPNVTLHVPADLHEQMLALPDEVNLSAEFQRVLRELLRGASACNHALVECVACSRRGNPAEFVARAT